MEIHQCQFTGNYSNFTAGAIRLTGSTVTITNSSFDQNLGFNGHAIGGSELSSIRIENCHFENNGSEAFFSVTGAVFLSFADSVYILDNVFTDNLANEMGGAIFLGGTPNMQARIAGNSFRNNRILGSINPNDIDGGAGGACHVIGPVEVYNNLFINNEADNAGALFAAFEPSVFNNTFVGNHANNSGGAMTLLGDNRQIANNIFWNNEATVAAAIYLGGSGTVIINNVIEFGLNAIASDSIFTSGDAISEFSDNLNTDPMFVSVNKADFSLLATSSAIDNGTNQLLNNASLPVFDFAGNERVIGMAVDIGAYEYLPVSPIVDFVDRETILYPNPGGNLRTIHLGAESDEQVELRLFNQSGKLMFRKIFRNIGRDKIQFRLPDQLLSGVYHLQLNGTTSVLSQQLILN